MKTRMKYLLSFTVLAVFIGTHPFCTAFISYEYLLFSENTKPLEIGTVESVRLTIIYDNNPYDERLQTAWGFSCYVNADGINLLFDTGGDPTILLNNMAKLDIDVNKIQIIVLSHVHGDHVGGISEVLRINNQVKVYIPASFPSDFKKEIRGYGCEVVEVKTPMKICEGVATTGELGTQIKEQSLIVNTTKGVVAITGCAHPGVINIAKKAKELTKTQIYLIIGGFHLTGAARNEISSIIEELEKLSVIKVAPCHCSGDLAREMFKEAFGENYIETGVGADP